MLHCRTANGSLCSVATSICILSASFLFLVPDSCETPFRLPPLLMDQSIEVDDQEPAPHNDEPANEDILTTSSELENHSAYEGSR